MRRIAQIAGCAALLSITSGLASCSRAQGDPRERARALHKESPLIDGHNDYPWALRENNAERDLEKLDIRQRQPSVMTDIPRLREGGVGAQLWSVYVPCEMQGAAAVNATLEQIDVVYRMIQRYPDTFELALTAADVERIFKTGKIASMIGVEGGHSIHSSLATLRMLYQLGARYMTLTHSSNVAWADSATDTPKLGGLSKFGEEVVREMNRLGMLVDLSHVSPETMEDAIRVTAAPVIFSHSSARSMDDHVRNVPDNILGLLPQNGGVVMVTFVPGFISPETTAHRKRSNQEKARLSAQFPGDEPRIKAELDAWLKANPEPRATLEQVADHIDRIRKIAGIDHIGLGGDFDGGLTSTVQGLEDVSTYPALTAELLRRGYSDDDVKKILGQNLLRVMRGAEQVAAKLQKERGPSTAVIETMDGPPVGK